MPQFLPFAATGANGDPNFPDNTGGGGGGAMAMQYVQQRGGVAASNNEGATTAYRWTCPDDVFTIYLEMAAGGSSGGGNGRGGNGGGSGAVFFSWFSVVPGQVYNFTIGQGGGQSGGGTLTQRGGATSIVESATALLNFQPDVGIVCNPGVTGAINRGNTSYTNGAVTLSTNPVTSNAGAFDLVGELTRRSPRRIPEGDFWNQGTFNTDGNGSTRLGGSTWFGAGSPTAGNNGGGGGAGFVSAGQGGSDGTSAPGGEGGVAITWFSTEQTAAMNPIVLV